MFTRYSYLLLLCTTLIFLSPTVQGTETNHATTSSESSIRMVKTKAVVSEFQVKIEELYGLSSDVYEKYIIPQQFILGFDATKVSNTTHYLRDMLQTGGFVNATILWHYHTTTFTGATIAGVDDLLYATLEHDPNILFIEPVRY
jgi:hypothetical protein